MSDPISATIESLRTRDGRAPRVALLVYNDAHSDSRVIKTAESLRSAGADVRVFAVARVQAGRAEGEGTIGDGVPVHRGPEFTLARHAPGLLRFAQRTATRLRIPAGVLPGSVAAEVAPAPAATAAPPASGAPGDTPATRGTPAPSVRQRMIALAGDGWLRAYRSLNLGLYWLDAVREATAWRPDVIHANDGNTLVPAQAITRRTGARVVYDAHELWRHRNVRQDRPVAPVVEAAIESVVIRRAAGVITVSGSIADWLKRTYRLPARPTLVRNAPRGEARAVDPARGRLRALAGLTREERVIAYGGRLTTSRGIEETLEAMTHLPEDVHFVLLGYGEAPYLAQIDAHAARLGVAGRVHRVGAVPPAEVATALADGDVAVVYVRPICLSYEYSLPNKLFESIHAGLPIVAADLPDTGALVREHGVGRIFDLDSPQDLARTIGAVLADGDGYRAAARAAARDLTWQHEEAALLALYRRVLA